jgi:HSP20 family protein
MDSSRTIRLSWLHGSLHDLTHQLAGLRFSRSGPHAWRPAINAYRCEQCIRICVDLAGVERSDIDLTIEGQRLSIRGVRDVPEPSDEEKEAMQMIAMEIDYGPFEREVRLPEEVDVKKVRAEQNNGLLWIYLPLKKS